MRSPFVAALTAQLVAGAASAGAAPAAKAPPAPKSVVFLAGGPSHGRGTHEHYAGCRLLADHLQRAIPDVTATVSRGWPAEVGAVEKADAVAVFCDGGGGHLLIPHLDRIRALTEQGVGLVCLHYAVVVPKGKPGDLLLDAMGGCYETWWSVNPVWEADFGTLPDHPITRGVKPFRIKDEWYYHMRFREPTDGVVPILTAIPPDATRQRKDGPHSGNPHVRARMGMSEHVAWAYERPDGGRGFGFTGGHWHRNWAHDDFRKLVLNAIAWSARIPVPSEGVLSPTPTPADLEANLD